MKKLESYLKLDLIRRINHTVQLLNDEIAVSDSLKRMAQKKLQGDFRTSAIELIARFGKFQERLLVDQFTKDTKKELIQIIQLNEQKMIDEIEKVTGFNRIMADILLSANVTVR